MAIERDIEIGIGSDRSKRGASAIRRALDSIKRKSKQVHDAGARHAKKHSKSLGLVAKAMAAISGFVIARSLIKSQIDFGQAVADLSAITGAVGEDLEFLRKKSKEFGETTTLSATQAAEAFKIIASAKPDLLENVEALSLVTEEAIALAEATGETLPTAANAMAAALNQFGAGAEESSRFINVLAAGSKRGAALVGEMAEALKNVGTIASIANISFEETNAALQLMSTRAIKGGEAGMQFRGMLLALTAQSRDEFKPEVVGLQQALQNLADAGFDEGSDAVQLFGRRNLAVANTLIVNRDQLGKLTKQLTGTNIAYEQQAVRIDNLSGDIKAMKSAYEGLELTIGEKLNGALRAVTQSATENIRALARNPLLQKGTTAVLDTIHRILEDIGLAFDQITEAVTKAGGGAAVFEGVWQGAIERIVKWTKFLWQQFVIGGPANLKLGFTLMIAAADRFANMLVEKIRTAFFLLIDVYKTFQISFVAAFHKSVLAVQILFKEMAGAIGRTFDNIKININAAIDAIIEGVASKVQAVADTLESLSFEERAAEIRNIAEAISGLASNEDAARKEAEKNEQQRKKEIEVINELIRELEEKARKEKQDSREITDQLIADTEATAEARRNASREAVQQAVEERDATLATIEALRTKRKEIQDGAAEPPPKPAEGGLSKPPEDAEAAYEKLGDVQKRVVDNMSDGIADMAASGKANFKDFAGSVIRDIIRMVIKAQALKFLSSIFGGLGGGAAAVVGGVGAGGGVIPTGGGPVNAQHGAEFMVGGVGGPDSQRVMINATPGETVTVRTPRQVKEKEESLREFLETVTKRGQAQTKITPQQAEEDISRPAEDRNTGRSQVTVIKNITETRRGESVLPQRPAPMINRKVFDNLIAALIGDKEKHLQRFEDGGEFTVGGTGGKDSQVVSFKASPEETVKISKPSQSKGGQAPINITFEQNIVADGADSEKLQAELPGLLDQARKSAVADVIMLRDKGVFRQR